MDLYYLSIRPSKRKGEGERSGEKREKEGRLTQDSGRWHDFWIKHKLERLETSAWKRHSRPEMNARINLISSVIYMIKNNLDML